MAPVIVDPARIRAFPTAAALDAWYRENHDTAPELWLQVFKVGSGTASVGIAEALDCALCWGWIDAIRKSHDAVSYLQRYCPRGKKSLWSQINRDHVARLVAAGRMTEHGLRHVEAAKADGRWDAAYAGAAKMVVPPDLLAAIAAEPAALATFETLTSQNRFALAFRLGNLKTEAARQRNIARFVDMLKRGETLYPQGKKAPPA